MPPLARRLREAAFKRGLKGISGVWLHEQDRFANHSFAEGHTAIEGIDDRRRSLHGNSAKDVAFLGDTQRRARGDLVFKPEPKDELIEAGLAVVPLQQLDSRDQGWPRANTNGTGRIRLPCGAE
jgi:hypothetical protein